MSFLPVFLALLLCLIDVSEAQVSGRMGNSVSTASPSVSTVNLAPLAGAFWPHPYQPPQVAQLEAWRQAQVNPPSVVNPTPPSAPEPKIVYVPISEPSAQTHVCQQCQVVAQATAPATPTPAPKPTPPAVKPAPKPVAKAAPKIQDLNKANEVQLFSVPGIDRTLARMIVENRPFKDLEDFKSRKCGNSLLVTPENFKKMEKYVVVKTS